MFDQVRDVISRIERDWSEKRLVIVGDVMLDKYIWGEVTRISPEAPVPVVRATHQSEQPGGAANVAMNAVRLGAQVVLAGFRGEDENGAMLEKSLRSSGISSALVPCNDFPTITKLRIIGGRQQMLRLDHERSSERQESDYERLLESVLPELSRCDAVILSDYAKGALTPRVCQAVIQAARKLDLPVLVDPKSRDFDRYRGATTICPNLGELSLVAQADRHDLGGLLTAAESMVRSFDLQFLAVTLSEKGIALVYPDSRFIAPAVARQVFDVSGAGDTVIAVLALGLAAGLKPEISVQLANIAAGIVVGKVGTAPVEKHELLTALDPEVALNSIGKVVDREELAQRVALWRGHGEHIAFTNGCFDLLHIGHITVLEQARRLGDRLIVAINSDASVRNLKGPTRPIVAEAERARILAAMAAVDAVVIFDEPTPLELIVSLKPDVLVKGGDYDPDAVVGAREIQSWGGQVRIVPLVEGISTTILAAKGAGDNRSRRGEADELPDLGPLGK